MAIKALAWMVRAFEPPVYCYHEIVHNAAVVAGFERAGVVFVDDVTDVPPGRPIMLSAHGSAPDAVNTAADRAGVLIDAVCAPVTKVTHELRRMGHHGYDSHHVGHGGSAGDAVRPQPGQHLPCSGFRPYRIHLFFLSTVHDDGELAPRPGKALQSGRDIAAQDRFVQLGQLSTAGQPGAAHPL